jgi:hypothetical protein
MTIAQYDVKLNGKRFLVVPDTYREGPVTDAVKPFRSAGGDQQARSNDDPAWSWWSQTLWEGEGVEDWEGDGGYYRGTGINIISEGEVSPAGTFTLRLADATNPSGYWPATLLNGATRIALMVGKDTGRVWTSTDLVTWTQRNFVAGSSRAATSLTYFKGDLLVGDSTGAVWKSTADGSGAWTSYSVGTNPGGNCYLLGAYRNLLLVAWGRDLRSWDGTTQKTIITLAEAPTIGAVGAGVMFIIAPGNPSHLYMMQGDALVELLQWPDDFQTDDAIFADTLYVSGGGWDTSGGWDGNIWQYTDNGLVLLYDYPDLHGAGVDYRIRSLAADGTRILFSANKLAGVGSYDPSLDIWERPVLGFSINDKTAAVRSGAGQVVGILPFNGLIAIGVCGEGIFSNAGFSDWQVTSSLFGATSKRVGKMWGLCELTHTALVAGQSLQVEYSTNGGDTWTSLGTKVFAASYTAPESATKSYFPFPANTISSILQYRVTATCNNADLGLLDISFSFIEASQNPKRRWSMVLGIQGSDLEPMQFRDGTDFDRSGPAMKAELDALWNKRFAFEDLYGVTRNVVMPAPAVKVREVVKEINDGTGLVESVVAEYTVHLVEV